MGKRRERKIETALSKIETFLADSGPADFLRIYDEALQLKRGALGCSIGYLALERGVETQRLVREPYPKDLTVPGQPHPTYFYSVPEVSNPDTA